MSPRPIILVLLVALVMLGTLVEATDWPGWRGPNGDGSSPETGINKDWAAKTPPVLWQTTLYAGISYGGPAIVNGKVYILDDKFNKDIVRCFDEQTGQPLWESITFHEDEGCTRSTPLVVDGKVYTFSSSGRAVCLDAETGKQIWTVQTKDTYAGKQPWFYYNNSPFIDGNKLILLPNGAQSAIALDKDTGKLIWQGGIDDRGGYATPLVATLGGVRQYVIFGGVALYGVDPDTGKTLWTYPWETHHDLNANAPLIVGDDMLFITSGYGHGCALLKIGKDSATKVYETGRDNAGSWSSKTASPVLYKDCVYLTSENENLGCLDVKTGEELWRKDGFGEGGLIVVEDVLIVQSSSSGDTVMVKPTAAGYQELGREHWVQGYVTAPAYADKKLYIRDQKTFMCIDLDPDSKGPVTPTGTGTGTVLPVPIPVVTADRPDLIVTDITWAPAAPKAGDTVTFTATVKNQGKAATPDGMIIGVRLVVDGTSAPMWSDTDTTALAPGASVTLTANGGTAGSTWAATTGKHTVVATVDDVNRIDESNEENNTLVKDFTVL